MISKTFLLFLLTTAVCQLTAQTRYMNDSVVVFALLDKAEESFSRSAYSSALQYCDKATMFSRENGYIKGEAFSLIKKADILIEKGDHTLADDLPAAVYYAGSKIKDTLIMAISYLLTAQIHMYNKRQDEALVYFEKALKFKLGKTSSTYAGLAWNDMGYTYGQKGDLQKSAECLINALRQYELLNYQQGMAMVFSNLSSLFDQLGEKDKAISYAKKAIYIREKLNDYANLSNSCCNLSQLYNGMNEQEAAKYQELCIKYALLSGDVKRTAHSYVSSSLKALNLRKFSECLEFELKTIALLEKNNMQDIMLARRYIMAGTCSAEMRTDSTASVLYYKKGIELALLLRDKITLRDAYLHRAIFYKERKDFYNAYENFKKFIVYKDSLVSENTQADIADIETKYQTEKKDQQIFQLNVAQKIRQLEIDKQKAVISGNLLEARQKENEIELLSKSRLLQEAMIGQQEEKLTRQQLIAISNEQQLKLADQAKELQIKKLENSKQLRNIMITGIALSIILAFVLFNRYQLKKKLQQQNALLAVRNHIAKDLHDDIGSTLTSIKILSEVTKNNLYKDVDKASTFLQKIRDQSSEMEQGMSDIVWAIKPDNDKLQNMVIRMREYISHTLEPKNIHSQFNVDEQVLNKRIGMQQRRDLFLIFKEAINNAAKYSGADTVRINLEEKNDIILLTVSDDGKGFDASATTFSNGIQNIKLRAKALNGTAKVISIPGKGTTIHLTMQAT